MSQTAAPRIPDAEFKERVARAQKLIQDAGLDALLVTSHEADFANVRYFSNYWTLFEIAGVLIPAQGEPALLTGPESETYAEDRSKIKKIHQLVEYRESADPAYPGVPVSSFADVFNDCGVNNPKRIGLGSYLITPAPLVESLKKTFPNAEITPADDLVVQLRQVKSEAEQACMRRAFQISEMAVEAVLNEIKPGMTEQQVVGIAQRVMYENGAEYEGHPTYVLSGRSTRHAISRPTPKPIEKNELIQLNIGARVEGLSSSVGLPICIGKMSDEARRLVEFGLEAHAKTIEWLRGGSPARDVAINYKKLFAERGFEKNFLYGPCHSIGMMEVERPWLEETSTYNLQPGMTFQVDTFLYDDTCGLRWENGGIVTDGDFELMSGKYRRVIEL